MVNCTEMEKAIDFKMKGLNYSVDLERLKNNQSLKSLEKFFVEKQDIINLNSIKIIKKCSIPDLDEHAKIIESFLKNNKNNLIENCYNGFSNFFKNEINLNSYFIEKFNLSMGNLIYFHYFMTLLLGEAYDPQSIFLKYKKEYNFIKYEQTMALILELIDKETLFSSSLITKSYLKQSKIKKVKGINLPLNVGNQIIENVIMFLINDCSEQNDYSFFNYIYNNYISNYNESTISINIKRNFNVTKNFA